MKDLNRRGFLRISAGAMGGVLLTSCFGGPGGPSSCPDGYPDIPNGYRFYRVKSTGQTVGNDFNIDYLYGSAHILPDGTMYLDAKDADDRGGFFKLDMDFSGSTPQITEETAVLVEGETLSDGRLVDRFSSVDVNESGNVAAIIGAGNSSSDSGDHYGAGLYVNIGGTGFQPLLKAGDEFTGYGCFSNGSFGDVDIHADDNILVVAGYTPTDGRSTPGQGIFHIPAGDVSDLAMVNSTGEPIPGTDHSVVGFGLIDMHDDGNYVAQGSSVQIAAESSLRSSKSAGSTMGSVLLSSNVRISTEKSLLVSEQSLTAESNTGEVTFGPRIGAEGKIASIVSGADGSQTLYYDGKKVLSTGEQINDRAKILSFGTGSIGRDGILYYTMITDEQDGITLVAYNGCEHRILLTKGDVLSDGGMPVESIVFGTTTEHVSPDGKIAFVCDFEDESMSLVVGIPS